ncbi:MAG: hypothetical protein COY66_05895 [Candidatus Kerfeldbacteria bacterium CG_4_10_14_0_8_um_filter_42_10]|uniref:Uncharacterized protein n=1 Tax=Candidatus Kerfeldbacteria bacterium CG_4_10_14_0_8_um_filter_42_10 TaxID=2014248 RepID=A0A2M7RG72_9BACT|nr:MAG: hypothetical protein COY66_05895 [Candidatus Kerfeldbacteria bacterium CG_4_10_14_0_8_um_filter_42_10]
MKRIILVLVISGLLSLTAPVFADDAMVFDSTDNYLGACSFTDSSAWTLSENFTVSKFQIWYKWQTGETALPVTVYKDGVEFASFEAKRGDCDPYQTTWCNADYAINKDFSAGNYTTKIPAAYQCLKPGGTGTVRLYGAAAAAEEPNLIAPAPTNTNLNVNQNTNKAANVNAAAATNQQANANTNTTVAQVDEEEPDSLLIYILIGIIVVLVIIIIVLVINCNKKKAGKV